MYTHRWTPLPKTQHPTVLSNRLERRKYDLYCRGKMRRTGVLHEHEAETSCYELNWKTGKKLYEENEYREGGRETKRFLTNQFSYTRRCHASQSSYGCTLGWNFSLSPFRLCHRKKVARVDNTGILLQYRLQSTNRVQNDLNNQEMNY